MSAATGDVGTVTAGFGKAGKCRLIFIAGLSTDCIVGTKVWLK